MLCILRRGVDFPVLRFFFFFFLLRSPTKRDADQISNERTSQLLLPAACSCQGNKNQKGKEWHSKEVTEMPSFTPIGDHPNRVTTKTKSPIPINWIQAPYSTQPHPCRKFLKKPIAQPSSKKLAVKKKKKQRCDSSEGRSVLGGLEANAGSATGDDAGEMRERRGGRKGRNVHGHESLEERVRAHPHQIGNPAAPSQPPHCHHPNPAQSHSPFRSNRSLARCLPASPRLSAYSQT